MLRNGHLTAKDWLSDVRMENGVISLKSNFDAYLLINVKDEYLMNIFIRVIFREYRLDKCGIISS